ncbi:unnamed protein product [Rotaria sordida]|uniref:Uncharacterized protein n=1 Tax=Rotaria sordida TaxID=392033 RepID=A0A814IWL3_9BILA|nr:unnamed protein product [Rotaria sordida]CAF3814558.1 unnamed protein product [Rotaria sordida]CAF3844539.1 unnamed protein product [Rotaria sordida]
MLTSSTILISSLVVFLALSASADWNFGDLTKVVVPFLQQQGQKTSSNDNVPKPKFPIQACVGSVASGNYMPCIGQLAHQIWKLHNWSEDTPINICGMNCVGNIKGRLSSWKWKWDGKFRCDEKAPGIEGRDTKLSRNGAMEWAIKDFLNKAFSRGIISAKDFQC